MRTPVKKIHQTARTLNKPLLMTDAIKPYYPTIYDSEGRETTINFVDDYLLEHTLFDDYVKFQYGQRTYDCDEETYTNIYNEWIEECNAIVSIHLTSWARLYYALSLAYNPLWNVDGTEKEIYSSELTTNVFGSDKNTIIYGQDKTTNVTDTRSNETTDYSMSYDSNTEHESGRTQTTLDGGTDTATRDAHTDINTRDSRTDTSNVGEHTITKIRGGNIGVTETTALLNHEWEFRRKNFFQEVIETIIRETGVDYYED